MNRVDITAVIPQPELEKEPEDYERGGLIYCGKCGTPRQIKLNLTGEEKLYSCLCRCRSEAREREEEAFQKQQEADKIRRLRSFALADPSYRSWTFANDDNREPKMDYLRRYAEKWDEVRKEGGGLLLWGDVGTGKSYGAACVVNALTDRGIPCLMTTFIRLANELSGGARDDKNAYIDSLNRYPLLVIDDLGAERGSDYMQEMVFEVVDARYRSGRPLIVTTNLTLDYLKSPERVMYSRIYDRILEMTVPIKFTERRRGALHEEKLQTFRELLGVAEG